MSKLKTAFRLLKTPGKMVLPMADMGLFNWMPDRSYLKFAYHAQTGNKLNLDNPQTYNEKLQWLKLYDCNPLYHRLVDKYEVKQFIAEKIGSEYIIPTLGVWDKVEKIPFAILPDKFVLKCTHDSGSVVICKSKKEFDIEEAKQKLTSHMKKSIYWFGREWVYKGLSPRIIAEPYLTEESGEELKDYKVHCFNGIPKVILVCSDRFSDKGITEDFFDPYWNHLPVKRENIENSKINIQCPEKLEEMLSVAGILSKDIPFVRVDFYYTNHHLYVGEMTFFPAGGFKKFLPNSFDNEMGSWIQLPKRGIK